MTLSYFDTGIFLLAAGTPHPQRAAARALVKAVANDQVPANISSEVIAEVLHIAHWRHDRASGAALAKHLSALFPHPLVLDGVVLGLAASLVAGEPKLGIRAALHGACLRHYGITEVISTDPDLGLLPGIRRWDPVTAATAWRLPLEEN